MDDIAELGGVSKPVLYQHFTSKMDLYLALVDAACRHLEDLVTQAVTSTTNNAARVDATLRAFFEFTADESGSAGLVFESDLIGEDAVQRRIWQTLDRIAATVAQIICAETDLLDAEAHLVATSLVGMAEMNARYWMRSPGLVSRERAAALGTTIAWRGISGIPRSEANQ